MMNDRLIYKMLMRSCIFNDVKHDKKAFLCVTLLDFCKFLLCLCPGFSCLGPMRCDAESLMADAHLKTDLKT